jgi:hypothetical protein
LSDGNWTTQQTTIVRPLTVFVWTLKSFLSVTVSVSCS